MIVASTSVVDQATYLDPTDPIASLTLAQLDQLYLDEQNGRLPQDDNAPKDVPEPASVLLLTALVIPPLSTADV